MVDNSPAIPYIDTVRRIAYNSDSLTSVRMSARICRTRRVKAKDRVFLAVFLAEATKPEHLPETEEVVVISKRTLSQIKCLLEAHKRGQKFAGFHSLKRTIERTA